MAGRILWIYTGEANVVWFLTVERPCMAAPIHRELMPVSSRLHKLFVTDYSGIVVLLKKNTN